MKIKYPHMSPGDTEFEVKPGDKDYETIACWNNIVWRNKHIESKQIIEYPTAIHIYCNICN